MAEITFDGLQENSLIMQWNTDSYGNPKSIHINTEVQQVSPTHNIIQLAQIPDEYYRVKFVAEGINGWLLEVRNLRELENINNFYVDYNHGIVYFHEEMAGRLVRADYYGRGVMLLSDTRIFHKSGESFATTLDEVLDKSQDAFKLLESTGGLNEAIELLDEKASEGTAVADRLENFISETEFYGYTIILSREAFVVKAKEDGNLHDGEMEDLTAEVIVYKGAKSLSAPDLDIRVFSVTNCECEIDNQTIRVTHIDVEAIKAQVIIEIDCGDGLIAYRTIEVTKVFDGVSQFNVEVTNSFYSFNATHSGKVEEEQSVTCEFNVTKANELYKDYVVGVQNIPTGMTCNLRQPTEGATSVTFTVPTGNALPDNGSVSLVFQMNDDTVITKTFVFSKTKQGLSAKSLMLVGNQIIHYENPNYEGTPNPLRTSITAQVTDLSGTPVWSYLEGEEWIVIDGQNGTSLIIYHNDRIWTDKRELTIKCELDGMSDEMTLIKIANGAMGLSSYSVILSNESTTLRVGLDGTIPTEELLNQYTRVTAFKGSDQITPTSISVPESDLYKVQVSGSTISLLDVDTSRTTVNIPVDIVLDNAVIVNKVWSISKTEPGEHGAAGAVYSMNIEGGTRAIIYNQLNQNPRPTFSGIFTATIYENGNDITSQVASWYWTSQGHLTGTSITSSFIPEIKETFDETILTNSVTVTAIYKHTPISYTVPIVISKDVSGLDWVTDWDSTKVSVRNTEILTPKLFAGTYNERTDSITGVAMGTDVLNDGQVAGITAWQNNQVTFLLGTDGSLMVGNPFDTDGSGLSYNNGQFVLNVDDMSIAGVTVPTWDDMQEQMDNQSQAILNSIQDNIDSMNTTLDDITNYVDTMLQDGLVTELEKVQLDALFEVIQQEILGVQAQYDSVINNPYLPDEEVKNLQECYVKYIDAYNNIVDVYNDVFGEGTVEEIAFNPMEDEYLQSDDFIIEQFAAVDADEVLDEESEMPVVLAEDTNPVSLDTLVTKDGYVLVTLNGEVITMVTENTLIDFEDAVTVLRTYSAILQQAISEALLSISENRAAMLVEQAKQEVKQEIADVDSALNDLETTMNGSFKSGLIGEQSKAILNERLKQLDIEKKDVDGQYEVLSQNSALDSASKTKLGAAKAELDSAHDLLVAKINQVIIDNLMTDSELNAVNNMISDYANELQEYSKVAQECNVTIAINTANLAVEAITDEDIFNKVTNYGAIQGLFIKDEKVYINSEYINTRNFKAVTDDGKQTFLIDENGEVSITAKSLSITGQSNLATQDYVNAQIENLTNTNVTFTLSNEFQIIPTDETLYPLAESSYSITVKGYLGSSDEITDFTIGQVQSMDGIIASVSNIDKKIILSVNPDTPLNGISGYIDIPITYGDRQYNKRWSWAVAKQQNQAGHVTISGEQFFKYSNDFTENPTPVNITLSVIVTNVSDPTYQWSFKQAGQTSWRNISGATSSTYVLVHNDSTVFSNDVKSITIRCTVNNDLSDEMTIVKISDGKDGADGKQGASGQNGQDGKASYLHVKYSDDGGITFTSNNGEDLGKWIGTYVDNIEEDSSVTSKYTWAKFIGEDGQDGKDGINGKDGKDGKDGTSVTIKNSYTLEQWQSIQSSLINSAVSGDGYIVDGDLYVFDGTQFVNCGRIKGEDGQDGQDGKDGINGTNGKDGISSYLHIKYSNDEGKTFTSNNGEDLGDYIGTYVDNTEADSTKVSDYKWKRFVGTDGKDGINGTNGKDGTSYYFYVRYSANANGSNMTTTPQSNSAYIGVCSTTSSTAPTNASNYDWTLIKGADGKNGQDGSPGAKGENGQTSYLHIKYSDNGTSFTSNNGETLGKWIGTYVDYTEKDSTTFSDYTWKKFVGEDGQNGKDGEDGKDGTNGADAYTVLLTNESHSFSCASNGNIASSTSTITQVVAYKGTSPIVPTIGTLPSVTGLTLTKSGTTITISANTGTSLADTGSFNIPITVDGHSFTKTFSWTKSKAGTDGKDGQDGKNGVDAYTVILTNENHTFLANHLGATTEQVVYTDVIAYKGTTPVTPTIGTLPSATGLTLSKSGTRITIKSNSGTSLADNGSLNIPITVDGQSFTKAFSWTKVKDGQNGTSGANAISVDLLASSMIFKSTDGGITFTPDNITLTAQYQNVEHGSWQFSTNGGTTWENLWDGSKFKGGITAPNSTTLSIPKSCTLFTDTVTSVVFKAISKNSSFYDIVTITKLHDVADLEVGGTNLILNSDFYLNKRTNWTYTSSWLIHTTEKYKDKYIIYSSRTGLTSDSWGELRSSQVQTQEGEIFTMSVDVKWDIPEGENSTIALWGYDANGGNRKSLKEKSISGSQDWNRVVLTGTVPAGVAVVRACISHRRNGSIYATNFKLERGNIATDWSPSPQDVTTEIDNKVNNLDTKLNQREVFNRLTNNGTSQGIFLENGQLYINGEYIEANTIKVDQLEVGSITMFVQDKIDTSIDNERADISDEIDNKLETERGEISTEIKNEVNKLDQSLTQDNVFNRLTNNGKSQGIFMQNGNFYINGEYINSKNFRAEDNKGNQTFLIDSNGNVHINANTFTLSGQNVTTTQDVLDLINEYSQEDNLLLTPNFNSGSLTNWSWSVSSYIFVNTTYKHDGNTACKLQYTGTSNAISLATSHMSIDKIQGGSTYKASMYIYCEGLSANAGTYYLRINGTPVGSTSSVIVADRTFTSANLVPNQWVEISFEFTPTQDYTAPRLLITGTGSINAWVTDFGLYKQGQGLNQEQIVQILNGAGQGFYIVDGQALINAEYIQTGTLAADLIKVRVDESSNLLPFNYVTMDNSINESFYIEQDSNGIPFAECSLPLYSGGASSDCMLAPFGYSDITIENGKSYWFSCEYYAVWGNDTKPDDGKGTSTATNGSKYGLITGDNLNIVLSNSTANNMVSNGYIELASVKDFNASINIVERENYPGVYQRGWTRLVGRIDSKTKYTGKLWIHIDCSGFEIGDYGYFYLRNLQLTDASLSSESIDLDYITQLKQKRIELTDGSYYTNLVGVDGIKLTEGRISGTSATTHRAFEIDYDGFEFKSTTGSENAFLGLGKAQYSYDGGSSGTIYGYDNLYGVGCRYLIEDTGDYEGIFIGIHEGYQIPNSTAYGRPDIYVRNRYSDRLNFDDWTDYSLLGQKVEPLGLVRRDENCAVSVRALHLTGNYGNGDTFFNGGEKWHGSVLFSEPLYNITGNGQLINTNTDSGYIYFGNNKSTLTLESKNVAYLNNQTILVNGVQPTDPQVNIYTGNSIEIWADRDYSTTTERIWIGAGNNAITITSSGTGSNVDAAKFNGHIMINGSNLHKKIYLGTQTASESGRNTHNSGVYAYNLNSKSLTNGDGNTTAYGGYWSILTWGSGGSGSAQLAIDWTSQGRGFYMRSLRDTQDNWFNWKRIPNSEWTLDSTSDERYKRAMSNVSTSDCYNMVKNIELHSYLLLTEEERYRVEKGELDADELFLRTVTSEGIHHNLQMGVLAQDMLKYSCGAYVVNQDILRDENGDVLSDRYGIDAYNYASAILGGLQEEIKVRDEQYEELKKENEDLKARLEKLEKLILKGE